jgi:hypothetical protein
MLVINYKNLLLQIDSDTIALLYILIFLIK